MKKTRIDINDMIRREYRDELRAFFYFLDIPLRRKDARYSDNIKWLKDYMYRNTDRAVHGDKVTKLVNWLYDDLIQYPSKWL